MCIGGGPVGPQKYSGGGPAVPNPGNSAGNDGSDDSDNNSFRSLAYHNKIRDDADKRRTTGSREAAEGRKGQKTLLGSIKSMF